MYFLIADNDLLEKRIIIWDKFSPDIKKEFDCEPAHRKKFQKTKIKCYGDEVADLYNEQIPKVDSTYC